MILRGGRSAPNYGPEGVADALERLRAVGLPERLVVDASHDNSGKDHLRQPLVADDIAAQLEAGQRGISGVMLESFLVSDRQDLGSDALVYGQSVTDACIDWDTTEALLDRFATAVSARRTSGGGSVQDGRVAARAARLAG